MSNRHKTRPNKARMRAAAKRAVRASGKPVMTKAEWDEKILEKRKEYLEKSGGIPFPNRAQRREDERKGKNGSGLTRPTPRKKHREKTRRKPLTVPAEARDPQKRNLTIAQKAARQARTQERLKNKQLAQAGKKDRTVAPTVASTK